LRLDVSIVGEVVSERGERKEAKEFEDWIRPDYFVLGFAGSV
jgi:hypothetical protein